MSHDNLRQFYKGLQALHWLLREPLIVADAIIFMMDADPKTQTVTKRAKM